MTTRKIADSRLVEAILNSGFDPGLPYRPYIKNSTRVKQSRKPNTAKPEPTISPVVVFPDVSFLPRGINAK